MVRQWSPPYNRSQSLRALKRYGQRGGTITIRRRRRRTGGTIVGPRLPEWYIRRRFTPRRRRRTR